MLGPLPLYAPSLIFFTQLLKLALQSWNQEFPNTAVPTGATYRVQQQQHMPMCSGRLKRDRGVSGKAW